MLRFVIICILFWGIHLRAQTLSYLEDTKSPGSVDDIVLLLNLKGIKKISVFNHQNGEYIHLGGVTLNRKGICLEKRTLNDLMASFHKYDNSGNLVIEERYSVSDSSLYDRREYMYNDQGSLIEATKKDKTGLIVWKDTNSFTLSINVEPISPRYRKNGEPYVWSPKEKYSYNSKDRLVKYFTKGFHLLSSKSQEEADYKRNKLEYTYRYDRYGRIKKYKKNLTRKSYSCEEEAKFNYLSENVVEIEVTYSKRCRCVPCYEKLLYKIEYY